VAHAKQKLTPLTVTKLAPKAQAYLVWDTYQRGFALQVQPTGYRAYKLIYRCHNRPRWYHIGAADAIGLADDWRTAMLSSMPRSGTRAGNRQTNLSAEICCHHGATSSHRPSTAPTCARSWAN
jgi:hypothetical protein